VLSLDAQTARAREATSGLQQSTDAMRKAVDSHEKTVLDLAAVESASQDSRATMLALEQEFEKQRLGLNKILGAEPEANVALRESLSLPTRLTPPAEQDLFDNLESHRLDLLGLRQGMESQDATVRAAILAQFPKMSVAIVKASDTTNVHTTGFAFAVDVPIFDRNQGVIATERATRQRLLDEYNQRLFEARSEIAIAIADIRSLDRQIAAAEEALPLLEKLVDSAQTAIEQQKTESVAQVQVAKLERKTITEKVIAYGSVVAQPGKTHSISIAFETRVRHVLVSPGQFVHENDPLIEIELSPGAQVQFQQAKNAA